MTTSQEFESAYDSMLRQLERQDQRDKSSMGEDQDYEQFYMEDHRERFGYIFERIPSSRSDLRILDVGPTPFTFLLNDLLDGSSVSTIDFTDLMKERSEDQGVDHVVHDLNEGTVPFEDEQFDLVIFHGVLEHLLVPAQKLIDEFARVLDAGGRFILGTPNFATLKNRIELLLGQNPQEMIEEEHVHGVGHVREFTVGECRQLVRNAGLVEKEATNLYYKSIVTHIKNTPSKYGYFGDMPKPLVLAIATAYYLVTLVTPNSRYHAFVVGDKPRP
ncbi:bifunctional 2-polyprenyl-6-hydroxyphenol methylase/3-demethylubiquinol 3-O-methyltransferase UbiG [Halorubrum sp. CBA1125]|uniref:class I SAM-dependent methyltransferase n=1 Tax=Halorubrum sp. CBA1125 TaxID=2668072 RepID=UPI0018D235E4|nr:class I SAM-dependent methyltransferase [Halorubrum sp. CBA1125]